MSSLPLFHRRLNRNENFFESVTDPNLSNLTDIALQTVTVVITAFDLRLIVAELDRLITDGVLDMHKLTILLKD